MPGRAEETEDPVAARPSGARDERNVRPPVQACPALDQTRPDQTRPDQTRPELNLSRLDQLSPSPPAESGQELAVATPSEVARQDPSRTDGNVMVDVKDDRWHWRRKIRADPRTLVVYRFAVGFAGLLFVVLGLVTGPIPGPGGIPLVLLGLAIWSSEFEWAQRLMHWFKERLDQFREWNRWQQTAFWIIFFACCGLFGYCSMVIVGVPGWVPDLPTDLLQRLPGI